MSFLEQPPGLYFLTDAKCLQHVVWKDKKAFTADMKPIYYAPNKQFAQTVLADFADRWESKYPYATR
jgi:transposase-like protein